MFIKKTPKFVLTPQKIVEISQKYISDPSLVSHKSSTACVCDFQKFQVNFHAVHAGGTCYGV